MSVKVRPYRGTKAGNDWEIDIRFEWPDGDVYRERKRTPCDSRAQALRWGEAREREMFKKGKEAIEAEKRIAVPTLEVFWERYLSDHCIATGHAKSTLSLKNTLYNAQLLPHLGQLRLDEIGTAHVDKLKAAMADRQPKTVNNTLSLLSNMLNMAKEWGVIEVVKCKLVKRKDPKTEAPFFTFEDFAKLEASAKKLDRRIHILVLLGGRAGMRRGEIIALRWENVDFARGMIKVVESDWHGDVKPPKSGKARDVPMTKELSKALRGHMHKGSRVLLNDDKKPLGIDTVRLWITRAEKEAGLEETGRIHILRHTLLSHLAMKGAPLRTIQEVAGHHALSMTARYLHLSPNATREAMGLLDEGAAASVRHGHDSEFLEK